MGHGTVFIVASLGKAGGGGGCLMKGRALLLRVCSQPGFTPDQGLQKGFPLFVNFDHMVALGTELRRSLMFNVNSMGKMDR